MSLYFSGVGLAYCVLFSVITVNYVVHDGKVSFSYELRTGRS